MEVMKDIKFVNDAADATGYGCIVYNQRYFGLPMELVEYFKALYLMNDFQEKAKELQAALDDLDSTKPD
jgi:hypothetical protein